MDPSLAIAAAGQAGEKLGSIGSFIYQIIKDQHLTGAQREANAFTADQNQKAMDFSASQTQAQMEFQREMANTQWQRGVEDMQAAGLNPALAYGQGGAVAPAGASASGSAGSSVDPGRGMSLSEMLQAAAFKKQLDKTQAETENIEADTEKKKEEKDSTAIENDIKRTYGKITAEASLNKLLAETEKLSVERELSEKERDIIYPLKVVLLHNEGKKMSADAFYSEWHAQYVKRTGAEPSASALSQLLSAIYSLASGLTWDLNVPKKD